MRRLFHVLGSLGIAETNYNPVQTNYIARDFSLKMPIKLKTRLARKISDIEILTKHSLWISNQYQSRINSKHVRQVNISSKANTIFVRFPLISKNKKWLIEKAKQSKVELAGWYSTPIHPLNGKDLSKVFYEEGSCPNVELRCQQIVTLPTHMNVNAWEVDRIISFLNYI